MRAEDLFEAVGEIDEKLIARSDRRVRSSQEKASSGAAGSRKTGAGRTENGKAGSRRRRSRRSMGAEIYRFTVVAMTTAVAVFLILMARDFLGIRSLSDIKSSGIFHKEAQESADSAEITQQAAAGVQDDTKEQQEQADLTQQAQGEAAALTDPAGENTQKSKAVEQTQQSGADAAQQDEEAGEAAEKSAGSAKENAKAAVDLLGDLKGDYVSLEYISAEDEANGGSRKTPDYSQAGEKALSEAFSKGKATPSITADKGKPTYYVYLTKKNGEVHKATFYEKCYVSLDNYPGVVMKISEEEYEDVIDLFR